jgi:hypothetical protein
MEYVKSSPNRRAQLNKQYGSSIPIGRKRYKITWCDSIGIDGQNIAGLCDSTTKKIFVLDSEDVKETLIHEVLHAEIYEAGMRQMPSWSIDLEELVCECAARAISFYKLSREK